MDSPVQTSPVSSRNSRPASLLSSLSEDDQHFGDVYLTIPQNFHGNEIDSDAIRHLYIEQANQSIKSSTARPFILSPFARDAWPPRYDAPLRDIVSSSSSSAMFKSHSAVNVVVHIQGCAGALTKIRERHPDVELTPIAPPAAHGSGPSKPTLSKTKRRSSVFMVGRKQKLLPVIVQAKSVISYVTLSIPHYPILDVPLQMRARSLRRSCNVFIPPEFSGIVSWSLDVGSHGNAITQESNDGRGMGSFKLSKGLRASGRVIDLTGRLGLGPKNEAVRNVATDADVKKALKVHALLLKKRPNRGLIKVYPVGANLSAGVEPPPLRGDLCELVTARGNVTLFEADEFQPTESGGGKKNGCIIA